MYLFFFVRLAFNPFAKKAPLPVVAPVVQSPGPFSKVVQHEAKGIERTDSFYARVDSNKSKEPKGWSSWLTSIAIKF